jgi:hypothetical protein
MIIKTTDLTGYALDWAVAEADGVKVGKCAGGYLALLSSIRVSPYCAKGYSPSTSWDIAGPLIQDSNISIIRCDDDYQNFPDKWMAQKGAHSYCESTEHQPHEPMLQMVVYNDGSCFSKDGPVYGPTPLVAAMRCFVANTIGEKVDVPEWVTK